MKINVKVSRYKYTNYMFKKYSRMNYGIKLNIR